MAEATPPPAVIVMGVCGTGKSTIGRGLAAALDLPFVDADDHHPAANVAKMRQGIALTDGDREPWLDGLSTLIQTHLHSGRGIVLACSALRESYRERLQPTDRSLQFVFLHGDRELLASRLTSRSDHYMPATLLDSQLATLEVPAPRDALWCDVANPPATIVAQALAYIRPSPN